MKRVDGANVLFVVAAACLASTSPARPADPTYISERMTIAAGAQRLGSATYSSTIMAAQMTPIGGTSACNDGSIASLGFLSVLGDLPVPIILRVRQNAQDPLALDLSWTGVSSQFQVCRDIAPQNICAVPYAFSVVCEMTDTLASAHPVLFYNVIPKP